MKRGCCINGAGLIKISVAAVPTPVLRHRTGPGEVKKCAVRVLWLMQTFALQLASPLLPHQRTDFSTATLADLCTCVEFAAADC